VTLPWPVISVARFLIPGGQEITKPLQAGNMSTENVQGYEKGNSQQHSVDRPQPCPERDSDQDNNCVEPQSPTDEVRRGNMAFESHDHEISRSYSGCEADTIERNECHGGRCHKAGEGPRYGMKLQTKAMTPNRMGLGISISSGCIHITPVQ